MKTSYTAKDVLAGNAELEQDDFYFGEGHIDDDARMKMRGIAIHLLAVAEVSEETIQAAIDAAPDKPTEEEACDEAFDIAHRAIAAVADMIRRNLGLSKEDAGWEETGYSDDDLK